MLVENIEIATATKPTAAATTAESHRLTVPEHLVTAEYPVFVRPLGQNAHALVLYLSAGLDLETLERLAECTNRHEAIRRAMADYRA